MKQSTGDGGDKALRKYLTRYAEPEAAQACECLAPGARYGHVLCVPAYGEGEELLRTLAAVPEGSLGKVLIVVVVNESSASPDWVRASNRVSLAALRGQRPGADKPGRPIERVHHPRGEILAIDRTAAARALPDGQGVGLARKVAADVALAVWSSGAVESPWLHCSDADVRFPKDYFRRPLAVAGGSPRDGGPAALVYDFRHLADSDPATARAALRYEIFLRYYVLGLRSAGSRYAFHTIGSTLALSPLAYARVRGFPRRNAAEDFHLLAKLAKQGPVRALRGEPLLLSGRVSDRVPFGTGVGIAKELERVRTGAVFPAYDPRVFQWLGVWLRTLDALGGDPPSGERGLRDRLAEHAALAPEVDPELLYEILEELGAIRAAKASRGSRQLHERFDALRTLRFLHLLRERRFPSLPLETAIGAAPFVALSEDEAAADLVSMRETLARIEAS